ncbi:MAG: D-glycero-beta-D-manno-heptose 1-phosphate adenylyltransferase [Bdellovibrio sp. CG12_big_fil_rev_8_21_14_0_65_39_13]|nr:MAG: D-glycero-beta-D-manno-heptose 1-phosphate adenylyltransferase [Bdellovibrio sp. CG22_combo_CG10-13_8_21_14_all_39_27]PIQ60811.1 MAG: D-glycero-beta-D-manno-heptose 1-phosphate adenylyltransferase [Bdellovibrio sp. CG12_big_fil_rev_8_21_14_0_65_39_13]PIR36435.1 MAG: D-glycero-beta-D-manno-heptose 1-phosphate adenylyltransferase [Bdellovibrio sp. CG11_big_fil_rev_8_21_14_0_20_39_38]PJB54661.1 MAG: D-glycero-beta-D-manno-heptose 1-phosphate adenylyltransferase [Bdellovibrio sp. CG_4_9_14_3
MSELSLEAKAFLEKHKNSKIVFTNGCFDILHSGHVHYLNEAKALGDVLFVGLNSDASVKRLKGEDRPVNDEKERQYVLSNLKAVDFVEIFSEDTPYDLIKEVHPNILVKGGDWKPENIVGSDIVLKNGGQVISLKFIEGRSTTGIIKKIQTL